MKKTRKLQLVALLVGVSATIAGFASTNTTMQAQASGTGAFAMETGATIRTNVGESGMRWITSVSEEWYNATVPTGAKVEFGTFVTSADNVSSVEELNENFNNGKQDIACPSEAKFKDGKFTYYSSVIYNNVSTEKQKAAYAEELVARSYVRYSTDNGASWTYAYADAEDSMRCVRVVAATTILDEETFASLPTDEDRNAVKAYVGENGGDLVGDGYLEMVNSDSFDASSYSTVYENYKKTDAMATEFTIGEHYNYLFFNDNGDFAAASFQYVMQALDDEVEFRQVLSSTETGATLNGYYALGNDITLTDAWKNTMTFEGTLDGNGYAINGLALSKRTGLFSAVNGATVKNVIVNNAALSGYQTGVFAYETKGTVTFDNVYVSIAETTFGEFYTSDERESNPVFVLDNAYSKGGLLAKTTKAVTVKNSVVYMPEFLPKAHGFVAGVANNTINVENSTFIGGNGEIYGEMDGYVATVNKDANTAICDAVGAYKALYGDDFDQTEKENANGWSDMQIKAYEENHPLMVLNASNITDLETAEHEIAVLTEDIDFSNAEKKFLGENNYFKGVFDGQNHTMTGIDITVKKSGALFDAFAGSVKNVALDGICGNSSSGGGGLIADNINKTAYIENVFLKPKFICGIPGSVCRILGSDSQASHSSLSMKDVVIVIERYIEPNPKEEFWNPAVGGVIANGVIIREDGNAATSSMGVYMENCHCVASEVRAMATRKENADFELLSSMYGNDKYFFWEVGDEVGGTVMTEDDGLAWHIFASPEVYNNTLQLFSAKVRTNVIKLSDFLEEQIENLTTIV